ncbi:MAG: O-methyltransferase [Chitinophagaceae bacterium]|nr:O-methyltransferase [Chitinophagaceae bacterium]
MQLLNPLAEAYAERYSTGHEPLTEEVAATTESSHSQAHMMSSRLQGKFLEIFSILQSPSKILEIGTFTGFSALCLVKGLKEGGKLHTIELREEDAGTARQYFARSKYAEKIILHTGNALMIIPQLNEKWDLVFIDADKTGYVDYYNLVLPDLRSGGVILADNVLYHGEVLEEPLKGKNAKAISRFNEYVKNDDRVEHVLLPIRDGLMLIRKK